MVLRNFLLTILEENRRKKFAIPKQKLKTALPNPLSTGNRVKNGNITAPIWKEVSDGLHFNLRFF